MNPLHQQVAKCAVDRPLPFDPALSGEGRRFDLDREMAFAVSVVPGMAAMSVAVIDHVQYCRSERVAQTFLDFGFDGSGESIAHRLYIRDLIGNGS